ncbi:hypothetical protein IX308_000606 [Porphyromonas levii]|uniref:O-antigen polysaccharide polymerase Wzy n=1 Tax=Porphyromonas levii TaxID=28114 RepID=UPI001BA4D033|nr:O-antigen polysaccharide polymerase Wzy [Porphyromonas levii]MBR8784435.1 hypothetical protein [Porphyromonas levii]
MGTLTTMILTFLVSLILIDILPNYLIVMSITYIIVVFVGLYKIIKSNNEIISPFIIYILGFTLFLGGGLVSNAIVFSEAKDVFTFNFGHEYTLEKPSQIRLYSLIILTLICSFSGYYYAHRKVPKNQTAYCPPSVTHRGLKRIEWITIILLIILLLNVINDIRNVSSFGYMTLYRDVTANRTRGILIIQYLADILVAIMYAINYNKQTVSKRYKISLVLFFTTGLISILTGGRSRFVAILMTLLFIKFEKRALSAKTFFSFATLLLLFFPATNYLVQATRFTESTGSLTTTIARSLSTQGFSLMLFDLSTHVPIDEYPVHAITKILIPGWQLIAPVIDPGVKPYELALDAFLVHRISPNLYYESFGYGWCVLSDFFILSGGLIVFFLAFNFLFGYLLGIIEKKSNQSGLYRALAFLMTLFLFTLPRNSITPMLTAIILFLITYKTIIRTR